MTKGGVWESETMHSFRMPSQVEMILAEQEARKRDRKKQGRFPFGLKKHVVWKRQASSNKKRQSGANEDDDDWVFVQHNDRPVKLSKERKTVFVLPSDEQMQRESQKQKPKIPQVTREMTDTKFNWVFKRPLPHAYGRMNTNPVNDRDYMKTYNLKATRNKGEQVFSASLRASKLHELLRENHYDTEEYLDDLVMLQPEEDVPVDAVSVSIASSQPVEPTTEVIQQPVSRLPPTADLLPPDFTFGKPTKNRACEPSMYEILSWS